MVSRGHSLYPSAHSPRPKPNWLADSFFLSFFFSFFLSFFLTLSLSLKQKWRPSSKRNQIDTFIIRVCLPIMLRPRALGRKVAQGPRSFPAFSDNSRQQKKHKQNQSLSGLHVILMCFRLLRRIQAPFQAISGKIKQNHAISGKIRPLSGIFRHFQAESGKIWQNRAAHWIWKIVGQGSDAIPRSTNCSPFLGRVFLGVFHQNESPSKPQSNRKQWHHSSQDMATVLINPRYCHSLLNPIKMSACACKHCGRNAFLPAASSHGQPVVAEE